MSTNDEIDLQILRFTADDWKSDDQIASHIGRVVGAVGKQQLADRINSLIRRGFIKEMASGHDHLRITERGKAWREMNEIFNEGFPDER